MQSLLVKQRPRYGHYLHPAVAEEFEFSNPLIILDEKSRKIVYI
jgi:hypothetical protein